MDFQDVIRALGDKVSRMQESIQTEEATKMAFVMPFISALGFDIFNPMEVVPEFIADLGIKKGEKVDYCIFKDGKPTIIIECKHWKEKLDVHNSQLHRYFHVTDSKFGILTNGVIYRFYTDLVEQNKMDDKPFWEFNITDLQEQTIFELKKYHKATFSIENILSSATELKYAKEIKRIMMEELANPSEAFVKHFAKPIISGPMTVKALEPFNGLVKRALNQLISDMISERLKNALASEEDRSSIQARVEEETTVQPANTDAVSKVVTIDLEKEAFYIVRSILRTKIESNRITHRDTQSYFGILLDDNNRKPICRLYLEGNKKIISLLDDAKKEMRHEIQSLDDIYAHSEHLINTALSYDNKLVTTN